MSDIVDFDFSEEESTSYDVYYSDDGIPSMSAPAPDIYSLLNASLSDTPSSHSSPPPQIATNDPAIAFSTSINQSRVLIQNCFGTSSSNIYHSNVPGLIVLRIQDFSLLRADSRSGRLVPHFLIHGPSLDTLRHPDFARALDILNH